MRATIYLDLDGVLVDWLRGILTLAGVPADEHAAWRQRCTDWDAVNRLFAEAIGVPEKQGMDALWAAVDEKGADWWSDLPWTPRGRQLLVACLETGCDVVFVTSPSRDAQSAAGKIGWLAMHVKGQDRLNRPHKRNFAICSAKHMLAGPGKLLIDDRAKNCERFEEHGGTAINWPQPWNQDHTLPESIDALQRDVIHNMLPHFVGEMVMEGFNA